MWAGNLLRVPLGSAGRVSSVRPNHQLCCLDVVVVVWRRNCLESLHRAHIERLLRCCRHEVHLSLLGSVLCMLIRRLVVGHVSAGGGDKTVLRLRGKREALHRSGCDLRQSQVCVSPPPLVLSVHHLNDVHTRAYIIQLIHYFLVLNRNGHVVAASPQFLCHCQPVTQIL